MRQYRLTLICGLFLTAGCIQVSRDSLPEYSILGLVRSQPAAAVTKRIFVTLGQLTGNLSGTNGISAADGQCNVDGNKPATGTYKAMLVDGVFRAACTTPNCSGGPSEHIDWVLSPGVNYIRAADSRFLFTADDNAIFVFGTLSASLDTGISNYWTGFKNNNADWVTGNQGCVVGTTETCCRWGVTGVPIGGQEGGTGQGTFQDFRAVAGAVQVCNVTRRFVCVEQ